MVLLCALSACAPRAAPPRPGAPRAAPPLRSWRYDFAVDPGATALRAAVCFDGPAPDRLVAHHPAAGEHLRAAWSPGPAGPVPLPVTSAGIVLRGVAPGACVRYEAALDLPAARVGLHGVASRDDGLVVSTDRWLWSPDRYAAAPAVTARFAAPPGLHVSLPWTPTSPGQWRLDASTFVREGYLGLSRRPLVDLPVAGASLSVAGFGGALASDEAPVRAWLASSSALVAALYGAFPTPRTQVLLLGRPGRSGAVHFGLTSSAGGASVMFLVDPAAAGAAYAMDGTAVHEFVHLGQPVMPDEDAWLAEGLALYYELVLWARAGLLRPAAAWNLLHQGFARGRADRTGRTLAEDGAALRRDHHYSRVYWSGTALALLGDAALRSATGNARSLDDAVRAAHACCGDRSRVFGSAEVLARMDAAGGGPLFSGLARRYARSADFPALDALYERLGLRVAGGGVEPVAGAPDAAVRDAIMAGR